MTADIELQLSVSTYVFEPVAPGSSTLDGEFEFTSSCREDQFDRQRRGDWAVALRPWVGTGDLTSGFDADDVALGLDVPATYQLDRTRIADVGDQSSVRQLVDPHWSGSFGRPGQIG